MKFIFLLFILIIIVSLIISQYKKEKFTYEPKNINVVCIFTGYNIDEWDYNFIQKWCNEMKIYFVHNHDNKSKQSETQWVDKIKSLNVIYIQRKNEGWDTTAWKDTILNYYDDLKTYDELILMNNSMNYEKLNIKEICEIAFNYDLYCLYYQQAPNIFKYNNHLQSYFTIFKSNVVNSEAFLKFYQELPPITSHKTAVHGYEMKVGKYYKENGFKKIGAYICDRRPFDLSYQYKPWIKKLLSKNVITESNQVIKKAHLFNECLYQKWKNN